MATMLAPTPKLLFTHVDRTVAPEHLQSIAITLLGTKPGEPSPVTEVERLANAATGIALEEVRVVFRSPEEASVVRQAMDGGVVNGKAVKVDFTP